MEPSANLTTILAFIEQPFPIQILRPQAILTFLFDLFRRGVPFMNCSCFFHIFFFSTPFLSTGMPPFCLFLPIFYCFRCFRCFRSFSLFSLIRPTMQMLTRLVYFKNMHCNSSQYAFSMCMYLSRYCAVQDELTAETCWCSIAQTCWCFTAETPGGRRRDWRVLPKL